MHPGRRRVTGAKEKKEDANIVAESERWPLKPQRVMRSAPTSAAASPDLLAMILFNPHCCG